ncbi:hypothetical protein D3C84_1089150 [compost metagenome]
MADGDARRFIEGNVDTGGDAHANGLPLLNINMLVGVRKLDGDQLRLVLIVPGGEQCAVNLQRPGTPCFAASQTH